MSSSVSTEDIVAQFENMAITTPFDPTKPPVISDEIAWFEALALRMEDRPIPKRMKKDIEDEMLLISARHLIKTGEAGMLAEAKREIDQFEASMSEDLGTENPPKTGAKKQWRATRVVATFFEDEIKRKHWNPADIVFRNKLVRYIIAQKEKSPKTGRIHWQIYAQFLCQITSRKKAQSLLHIGQSYIAQAVASPADNIEYCSKDEASCIAHDLKHGTLWAKKGWRLDGTEIFTYGTPSLCLINGEGAQRWDLLAVKNLIHSGASLYEIETNHFELFCRYRRGIMGHFDSFHSHQVTPKRRVKVTCFFGYPGVGKSETVINYLVDNFGPNGFYEPVISSHGRMWFNKYRHQKAIVINEFYGQCPFSFIQKLIDNYRVEVETKGDSIFGAWDEIIFTSNCNPKHWWNGYKKIPHAAAVSLARRFDEVVYVEREAEAPVEESMSIADAWAAPRLNKMAITTADGKRKFVDAEIQPIRHQEMLHRKKRLCLREDLRLQKQEVSYVYPMEQEKIQKKGTKVAQYYP